MGRESVFPDLLLLSPPKDQDAIADNINDIELRPPSLNGMLGTSLAAHIMQLLLFSTSWFYPLPTHTPLALNLGWRYATFDFKIMKCNTAFFTK